MDKNFILILWCVCTLFSCTRRTKTEPRKLEQSYLDLSKNSLDYGITPKDSVDRSGLMFSDQGAWFAYGIQKVVNESIGFSGPFLMTEQNGVWLTTSLSNLIIKQNNHYLGLSVKELNSYSSHLEQHFENNNILVEQKLVFLSGHTAILKTEIRNTSDKDIELELIWRHAPILLSGMSLEVNNRHLKISSNKTNAQGYLIFPESVELDSDNDQYYIARSNISLVPNQTKSFQISQTFIFPEYSWENEKKLIRGVDFDSVLSARKQEKELELKSILENVNPKFQDNKYVEVLAKSHLTLQNNWRIPAGELKHEGLFPSYHYKWFNGFWSWDSWKHAVGLSYYNTRLAKNQMRAMFDFQKEDGFIVDCIYRDTTIEAHNYRDTKPPLSAWAVARIYEKDKDIDFVKEFYPKLKKYHNWWYKKRDHDQDGLCEYGSTDGSLIAAKWESGMDNAIRFDNSEILKNEEEAYSLNQESVDLNAYLYAEKLYLGELAKELKLFDESERLISEAIVLKEKIQNQFYDKDDGWFYDTNLNGTEYIKGEGSEGWTALWAKAATQEQAKAVKNKMMDPEKFYTKVPFQTMSADHERFDPLKGYWRGPNWLDQAYFGVKGLRNYGFDMEAYKATVQIIEGAEGVLGKGNSIRENYHPLTGKGLNAKNFSWSAAHLIMLLQND